MKALLASALAASVLFSGAAHAMTNAGKVSAEVQYILPQADYSNLTAVQIAAINGVVNSGGNRNDLRNGILGILK